MSNPQLEIVPLRDDPEPYCWTSPEHAEYYTIYERGVNDLAQAIVDVPTLDDATRCALAQQSAEVLLWVGTMFVAVRLPESLSRGRLNLEAWRELSLLPHEAGESAGLDRL